MTASAGSPATPRLAAPGPRYRRSFLEALREGFDFATQPCASAESVGDIEADFAGYVARTDQSGTVLLPTGETVPKVPFSVFWLVEDDGFIGQLNLRHELNDYLRQWGGHVGFAIRPCRRRQGYGRLILALGLEECRCRGMERILVTCLEDNRASARIIEANGGVLENVLADPAGRGRLRRYWISL